MEKQKNIKELAKIINNPNIRALIFDFDGVIVHLPIDYDALRKKLSDHFQLKYDFKNNFTPLNPSLELVKKKVGKKALREAYKIIEKYEIKSLKKAKPNKEIIDFIKDNSSHKKIVIFSMNMRETIKKFLLKHKLQEYIDCIVAKEDVSKYKPNPEGIFKILNQFNLKKSEAVFIGDKEIDLKTGRSGGVKSALLLQLFAVTEGFSASNKDKKLNNLYKEINPSSRNYERKIKK